MNEKAAGNLTLSQIVQSLRNPLIYKNFAIHLFVLIPATIVLATLATAVDRHFGWPVLFSFILRLSFALPLFTVGAVIIVYSYSYLLIKGEGSPGSHLGAPRRLVTSGPFAVVRHPSVVGKFLGLLGLGMLVGSTTFLLFFIPSLLAYSLITNRLLQERFCERAFGESYRSYRRSVPMILPHPQALLDFFRGKIRNYDVTAIETVPGAIPRYELTIYLILLAAIVCLSAVLVYLITAVD